MSLSDIIISGGNCHVGHNEPNCPRVWSIEGGPGWIGQRMEHPVEMICSPSCGLINKQRNNNDNEGEDCSLILALHGLYSNPSEQKWLMIGTADDPNGETFLENEEEENGPFCISFHKSVDYGWDWKCGGDDEAHLEAFIHYALDNFSIDPDAINLHGYSSGGIQINTMMNTGCSIESLISAVAVYGAGNVENPPTTKASYLCYNIQYLSISYVLTHNLIFRMISNLESNQCKISLTILSNSVLHGFKEFIRPIVFIVLRNHPPSSTLNEERASGSCGFYFIREDKVPNYSYSSQSAHIKYLYSVRTQKATSVIPFLSQ